MGHFHFVAVAKPDAVPDNVVSFHPPAVEATITSLYTMNPPNITIHCFVYKGDAEIIHETVMCARQALPEARMIIIDDENNPCPPETRQHVESLGAEWRTTSWPRGGNLRGKTCITGILKELVASTTSDNDVLIKMDADTCIMDGDDIMNFANDPTKILCAGGEHDVRVYGCCYCIRGHAVKKALDYIESIEISNIAAEDVVIGFTICNLFPDRSQHLLYKTDAKGTKWTAYHWWYYPDTRHYHGRSVITVGNRAPAPLTKKQRLPVMKNLRLQAASYIKEKAKRQAEGQS